MKRILAAFTLSALMGCNPTPTPIQTPPAPSTSTPTVGGGTVSGALQADVQLNKESYFPGEEIEVVAVATGMTDSAWVGVIPTTTPHGKEADNEADKLGYSYLSEPRLVLVAPKTPGEYDVRLNDNDDNGVELASRGFKVVADPSPVSEAKLMLAPNTTVEPGANLEVPFEAPLEWREDAWIGIIPPKTEHGDEAVADGANMGYEHIKGRTRGRVSLKAPSEPGVYDVRMFDQDSDGGKEADSQSFKVEPTGSATPQDSDLDPGLTP